MELSEYESCGGEGGGPFVACDMSIREAQCPNPARSPAPPLVSGLEEDSTGLVIIEMAGVRPVSSGEAMGV